MLLPLQAQRLLPERERAVGVTLGEGEHTFDVEEVSHHPVVV